MNELRQLALKLLARREHTRAELARKLAAQGGVEEIDPLLDQLQQSGLLSDARFAAELIRSQGARSGAARMRHLLRNKGVSADVAESALAEAELPDELSRARALWQRKFGTLPGDAKEWARQARFLQSRGFTADLIRRLLKDVEYGEGDDE